MSTPQWDGDLEIGDTVTLTISLGGWEQQDLLLREVVARWGDKMVTAIKNEWPVDTGYSMDSWEFYTHGNPSALDLLIINDVEYVQYVRLAGSDPDDPPLVESLLPNVAQQYVPQLLDELQFWAAEAARKRESSASRLQREHLPDRGAGGRRKKRAPSPLKFNRDTIRLPTPPRNS